MLKYGSKKNAEPRKGSMIWKEIEDTIEDLARCIK